MPSDSAGAHDKTMPCRPGEIAKSLLPGQAGSLIRRRQTSP
ncbi:hypothetical protein ASAP_2599 [Asaia bogorensis]|uniref:Uncharacterized protein n=1 Tax=Asaia bogorensis TaxID=91915 RepID=A0A060QHK8_9PROT|nr:hypothetical protein ASAP_2599 [Asaia bogorensis]